MTEDLLPESLVNSLKKSQLTTSMVQEDFSELQEILHTYDPVKTANAISVLLLSPMLQSNCFRLEKLAHIVVEHCKGKRKPTSGVIEKILGLYQITPKSVMDGHEKKQA